MKISILLEALTGSFDTDLDKSASKAEKRMAKMAAEFDRRFRVVAGAVAAAGTAVGFFLAQRIDAIGKFQDLAETIGDTAEKVASLKLAADTGGVSMEDIASASVKLTAKLVDVKSDTDSLVQAVEALGISFEDFKKLSPTDQIEAVAKAMAKFEDNTAKTAIATELFGKSGATLLPFLKDLAGSVGRATRLTQEQIIAADEMAEALDRTKSQVGLLADQIAGRMIIALEPAIKGFDDFVESLGGFDGASADLAANNEIVEWTQDIALGLAIAVESVVALLKTLRAIAGSFEVVGADIGLALEFISGGGVPGLVLEENRKELKQALDERNQTLAEANQRWSDLWTYNATALSDAIRDRLSEARGYNAELQSVIDEGIGLGNLSGSPLPGLGGDTQVPFRPGFTERDDPPALVFAPAAADKEGEKALKQHEADLKRVREEVLLLNDAEGKEAEMRALVNELYAKGEVPQTVYLAFLEESNKRLDDLSNNTKETTDKMTVFWEEAARNMQDALADFLFDPFSEGLSGMLEGLTETIQRMVAQMAAAQIFSYIPIPGGTTGVPPGKASGGPVAGGAPYIVGERGPEIMVPRSAGTIIPSGSWGGGGGTQVTVVNNTSSPARTERGTTPDGRDFVKVIIGEATRDIAENGQLSRAMSQAFGLQRKTVSR